MLREELRRGLEKELASQKGQRVFRVLKRKEQMLKEFPTVFDLINALTNPKAPSKFVHQLILRLIGMYRQAGSRMKASFHATVHNDVACEFTRTAQQVILAILLLGLWDDMERLTEEEHYRLWRIDNEPFSETSFVYMELMATGNFNHGLWAGEHIKSILYDEAKEFIKEEFKKQCVYKL